MNIKNRLLKLEKQTGSGGNKFCECGTPYFATLGPHTESVNDICPDCLLPVKPQTLKDFVENAARHCEIKLIDRQGERIPATYADFFDDCRRGTKQ